MSPGLDSQEWADSVHICIENYNVLLLPKEKLNLRYYQTKDDQLTFINNLKYTEEK